LANEVEAFLGEGARDAEVASDPLELRLTGPVEAPVCEPPFADLPAVLSDGTTVRVRPNWNLEFDDGLARLDPAAAGFEDAAKPNDVAAYGRQFVGWIFLPLFEGPRLKNPRRLGTERSAVTAKGRLSSPRSACW
jgi:hypothetical protein